MPAGKPAGIFCADNQFLHDTGKQTRRPARRSDVGLSCVSL